MTRQEIEKAIEHIREIAADDEMAHSEEDDLYAAFVRHVAETAGGELAECAKMVLTTSEIRFARWCA